MEEIFVVMVSKIRRGGREDLYINKCFNNEISAKKFAKKYERTGYKVEII